MVEFIGNMFEHNVHIMWHFIGGMTFGKIFKTFLYNRSQLNIIKWVLVIAVIWEIIELYTTGIAVYGNTQRYIADSLGDILIAVLASWIISR